ncbi:FtsW/RodA/SpoVE family cell cycle protein [Bifidobacterium vespertilionis]|uniref:FtsW/RodA/SpoVE family cell cycle protein n=1 Tax=Bifidobacterium vespertilionis TaxID=2562524 RepID=UPI001BDC1CA9|nr:FtsW/RodA/SpoVE family cell cycle protein [Bifidobacterium vespertilionis]MBT1178883.1 FtsW/RodA/SpoVE family cell cycle protein [Bifidobacterium vespertilionis]
MTAIRLRQFFLLLFSFLIVGVGFFQMFMRTQGSMPMDFTIRLIVVAALFVVLWALMAKFQPYGSQTLVPCLVLLSGIGVMLIARIDAAQNTGVAGRQLLWIMVSLVLCCALVAGLHDYRILRRFSYVSMVVGLALLLAPMLPLVGHEEGGSRIWLKFGNYTMQPAEFAKLFLAFFFAAYLFDHRDQLAVGGKKVLGFRLPRIRDLGPIIIVWLVSMGVLVMQRDLGTSLMFFAMFVSMLYVATGRASWIAIGVGAFAVGAVAASSIFSHVGNRITAWLHPFDADVYNAVGGSEQLVKGVFGLAAGGLAGTGLGQGHPYITPLSFSDFIYTSVGEELGLAGLLAVLLLYLIIIATGMVTAMKIKDGFGKLLASGLVFTMAFQVFTVVGGVTLLIPLTGLTMPYMAAGGSSLVANMLLAMLLVVISNAANKPQPDTTSDTFQYEALAALREQEVKERAAQVEAQKAQNALATQVISTKPLLGADPDEGDDGYDDYEFEETADQDIVDEETHEQPRIDDEMLEEHARHAQHAAGDIGTTGGNANDIANDMRRDGR